MLIDGKVILITGGTGSFGNSLIRRLIITDVREIRIFSRDEKKQSDMRRIYSDDRIKYFIGDIRDSSSMDSAFNGVDIVFHSAAIKQVPTAEFFPMEAVKTNIIGSENVINKSIQNNVKKLICLSTDKAAYPINAMGISKAMMERVASSMARDNKQTEIIITRYGNVIGSRGSVIPLFFDQLSSGFLTITEPHMTRFLMSLDDAIELVFYAIEFGENGDLFVKKSYSAQVIDIANAVIKISQKKVDFKFIGPRHSEKYHENLLTKEEFSRSIDMGEFYRIPLDSRSLNYNIFIDPVGVESKTEYSSSNARQLSLEEVIKLLVNNYEIKDIIRNYLK